MVIGVPKEIKTREYRVSVTPAGASELTAAGHEVLVETTAGQGSGFSDEDYAAAGARIEKRTEVFARADLIIKVKEPLPEEHPLLREGLTVFTFLHLAPNRPLIDFLLEKKITAFAYETLEDGGALPLLAPMSEIAGRMGPIMGSYFLQRAQGGEGLLSAGATGVPPARIVILGAGFVGTNAARVAVGLGMDVTVLNRGIERLRRLDETYGGRITTLPATAYDIAAQARQADILVGAVLQAGARAPVLVTRELVAGMKKGSVIVDVSVDQGGCVETTRATTHDDPVYEAEGVIHYAVANMPGAYPRTSTLALTNSTLPYVMKLASLGPEKSMIEDRPLKSALNTYNGHVMHRALAESVGLPFTEIK